MTAHELKMLGVSQQSHTGNREYSSALTLVWSVLSVIVVHSLLDL